MREIKLKAFAKINLTLKIIKKLKNGYHKLDSIFASIDLADLITIQAYRNEEIPEVQRYKYLNRLLIISKNKNLPKDRSNILYKVMEFLSLHKKDNHFYKVYIDKNIPIGAGLGGGSADAAGVYLGIKKLLNLKKKHSNKDLAYKIGADIPFFIKGGTAKVSGIGEKIKKINCESKVYIVLVNPNYQVSTKWAYKKYDKIKTKGTYKNVTQREIKDIYNDINILSIGNDLEKIVLKKYPELIRIKTGLLNSGAYFSQLSGSGPTMFGLFKNKNKAYGAVRYFINKGYWSKLTVPKKYGILQY